MEKYALFKIKEGKYAEWKAWMDFLLSRREEVMDTLKEENADRELWVSFGDYVLGMERFVDAPMPATPRKLNNEHKKKKDECLEFVSRGSVLADFY